MSPAALKLHFNLNDLDSRGDKDFGSQGGSVFEISGRKYHQPSSGWVRYGLNILGKSSDDTWLHPFQDPRNWHRAFHGTASAHNIYCSGFKPSASGTFGPGVYVSPFVEYAESYAQTLAVDLTSGTKQFKVVLQVAVKPDSIMKEGRPGSSGENQEWTVPPEHVRPYGLLLKSIDVAHSRL